MLILQRKECVTSNGSGNIDFSIGLFFKFYSFFGSEGKYTLEIGNNESGRLYLNLGDPPVTVYLKKMNIIYGPRNHLTDCFMYA